MSSVGDSAGMLKNIVEACLPALDYHKHYLAEVLGQNEDGTLELRPDDEDMDSMSAVPILHGSNGTTVKVAEGSRVVVAFISADPRQPVVTNWDEQGLLEWTVEARDEARLHADRVELGGTTTEGAVLGTSFRAADAAFDAALSAAGTTFAAGTVPNASALGALIAAGTAPPTAALPATKADVGALASLVLALQALTLAHVQAVGGAASAKEGSPSGNPTRFVSTQVFQK